MSDEKFLHDLKAPLQGIFCCIQLMQSRLRGEESGISRYMDMLTENALDMERLLRNAFDAEHLREGTSKCVMRRGDAAQTVRSVCRQYMPIAERQGIDFAWNLPENAYAVFDEDKIRRILQNLLINAMRFTPCGGRVRVNMRVDENICIFVSDTGCGIAESEREKIFDEGYTHGGEGMGLYIARAFARLHGGDVTVRSNLGQGSCFCVKFSNN